MLLYHTATCANTTATINTTNYMATAATTNSATTSYVVDTLDNGILANVFNKKQNYDENFVPHCCFALI